MLNPRIPQVLAPKPLARLALACLLAFAATAQAQAGPRPAPLVFAFTDLSPWLNQEGRTFTGAYAEIMRELARRVDRRLSIVDCPVKRCLAMLEAGAADLTIGLKDSPERAGYMRFLTTPYRQAVADRVFWVRRGEADQIQRYEDLQDLRVGVVAGSTYFSHFDSDAHILRDIAQSNDANLQKLLLGRVDTVLMPEDQALVLIRKLRIEGQVEGAKYRVRDPSPRFVGLSRASPAAMALLPQLEAAMQAMRRDGTLAALYDKHFYKHFGVTRQQIRVD